VPTALYLDMAIYHLNSSFVSRSTGRSSVQSAAYITGATLHESRRDIEVSYKNRLSDIAFTDTLAPKHAPSQFHTLGVWDILGSHIFPVKSCKDPKTTQI
jgi:hypothetical protein